MHYHNRQLNTVWMKPLCAGISPVQYGSIFGLFNHGGFYHVA